MLSVEMEKEGTDATGEHEALVSRLFFTTKRETLEMFYVSQGAVANVAKKLRKNVLLM